MTETLNIRIFPVLALIGAISVPNFVSAELPVPTKRPSTVDKAVEQATGTHEEKKSTDMPDTQTQECFKALETEGTQFQTLQPIAGDDGCGIDFPISIQKFPGGIMLEPKSELTCEAALAASKWIKGTVVPAAKAAFPNDKLTVINHGSTYVCRTRNRAEGAKLSEHAKGTAIDIVSFQFESGKSIAVEPRQRTGTIDEGFQKAVRFGACLYFTTVLGPFSDTYHSDHLHFDTAARNGGYRLCDFPTLPSEE